MAAFVASMNREVNSLAMKLSVSKDRAFNIWFARVALDLEEEDAFEATGIEGANDKSIDLFWIDKEANKIIIVQGKYGDGKGKFRPQISQVDSLVTCLNWLASPQSLIRDGKADLAEAAKDYVELVKEGYSVEFWFAYAGPKCPNVEKHIEVYNQNPANVNSEPPTNCCHCHIALLERYFNETIGKAKRLEVETIELVDGKHFEYKADFGEALVGTVPATELVRIYEAYEDKLFDRNVRLFLGAKKGSINAGIGETLRNSDDKANFWAYNNGLTLVCSKFAVKASSVKVEDFCIVNGCQSTRSLVDNKNDLDDTVTVLVRVLAVPYDLVDSVIRFTNSQNPIRTWDIASQHKTQRRLKNEFAELPKPYLYLTRRGDQPKKESLAKYKNGGKPRQIKLAEVGQYVAALSGQPVLAYKDKALIFSSRHDQVFRADIRVEEIIFASVCGEHVKEVVSKYRAESNDDETKILTKGGALFVLAVVGHVAKLRNGNAYLTQLNQEQITSNHGKTRQKKYAKYALQAYLNAVKDAAENRKEEFATLIRSRDFFKLVTDRVTRSYNKDALAGDEWMKNALPRLV